MNDTDAVKEFCHNHQIKIIDANKRAAKYHKVDLRYFINSKDYNSITQDVIPFETEPLLTVEIAASELERIAQFEQQVFNNMRKHGHYDMFNYIMQQKEEEKYLKEKYPAVQKAYEQYSLILKMAKAGEL